MGFFLSLTDKDFIIIGISVICSGIFGFVGADKLFKFYFGAIIGFLLFLVFNSEIAVISLLKEGVGLDSWQNFLSKNQDFVLTFFTCMIPLFGLFFTLNNTIHLSIQKSFLQSIFFGLFLIPFILGMFVYILKNSFVQLIFLRDILSLLNGSIIKGFFEGSPHIVFFFLLFILFYKMVFGFFIFLMTLALSSTLAAVKKSKGGHEEDHGASHEHHDDHGDIHHGSGHH